jgi:hypothetical protein
MADRQMYFVFGNARPGMEAEYNEWYDNVHLPQVLAMPGVISAQRFDLLTPESASAFPVTHRYLAVYEFEGDADKIMLSMREASASGEMAMHEGLEIETVQMSFWKAHGPKLEKGGA